MNKKSFRVFFFILIIHILSISSLSAQTINENQGLTVYDIRSDELFNSISMVVIYGWSPDGKVAIYQPGCMESSDWIIMDTVTDEVVKESDYKLSNNGDDLFFSLAAAMDEYGITGNPGKIVHFPYQFPDSLPPLEIDYELMPNETQRYNMYGVRGSSRKRISDLWAIGYLSEIVNTFGVKSPYENRLLIITVKEGLHIEFDYTISIPHYAGCHLTYGFE